MINALVIGAASELGSNIVLELIKREVSVTAVTRSPLSTEVVNAFKITRTNSEHKLVFSVPDDWAMLPLFLFEPFAKVNFEKKTGIIISRLTDHQIWRELIKSKANIVSSN